MTTCIYIACTQRHEMSLVTSRGLCFQDCSVTVWAMAHLAYVNSPFLLHLVEQVLAQIHRFGSQESVNCSNFWLVSILAVWSVWVLYVCTWVAPTEDRLRDKLSKSIGFRKIAGYLQQCLSQRQTADPWQQIVDCAVCSSTGSHASLCTAEDLQHCMRFFNHWGSGSKAWQKCKQLQALSDGLHYGSWWPGLEVWNTYFDMHASPDDILYHLIKLWLSTYLPQSVFLGNKTWETERIGQSVWVAFISGIAKRDSAKQSYRMCERTHSWFVLN